MNTWQLWQSCVPDLSRTFEIGGVAHTILGNWLRYKSVGDKLNIPAYVIGCLHYRESSFQVSTHLANGDPLFDSNNKPIATTHVPVGLGPFNNWEDGALAALIHQGWDHGKRWDLVSALDNLESYNGNGYQLHGINSPYIWAGTSHYSAGKYASDGKFDANLVDKQLGCAVILMALKSMGVNLGEIAS